MPKRQKPLSLTNEMVMTFCEIELALAAGLKRQAKALKSKSLTNDDRRAYAMVAERFDQIVVAIEDAYDVLDPDRKLRGPAGRGWEPMGPGARAWKSLR